MATFNQSDVLATVTKFVSAMRKRIGQLEAKLSSPEPDTQMPLAGV